MKTYFEHKNDVKIIVKFLYRATIRRLDNDCNVSFMSKM